MGNNHENYFGKDRRKILMLGLEATGKTTLLQFLKTGKFNQKVQKTKDLNIDDKQFGSLKATFFDLSGGERQRIFWKQNYEGSQGIIYLVDSTKIQQLNIAIQQLIKCMKNLQIDDIPFAIGISKKDLGNAQNIQKIKESIQKEAKLTKKEFKIFQISMEEAVSINEMMTWLLSKTKPI